MDLADTPRVEFNPNLYDLIAVLVLVLAVLAGIRTGALPQVGGIVHTHSTYACAWAARGQAIPCVLTMVADEFGGDVPVGPFALIGDEAIGEGIVATLRESRSPAVLMQNHGPFTIGKDAESAVKAAVMLEEVAKAVHHAQALGVPIPIPQSDIDDLSDRYRSVYGQRQE